MNPGTREKFRNWLSGQGMTYTKYTTLDIKAKAALYAKYQKKGKATDEAVDTRGE